ncbi:Ig-like domain-containing protein [Candidatus Leptofilum sp.]|uniref:Ig-like domain-containing protein n=1 Tax=Candidatus Leptofilum sp. TaxID=3241576 RepID=UPI003B5CA31E
MIHHREKDEVRRFDIFKLIILLILIALLLWFWLSPPAFVQGPDDAVEDTAVATDTTDDAGTSSVVDEPTDDEEMAEIDVPELESPVLTNGLEAGTVSLSGSGTPGSTVRIIVDGEEVGTTEVGSDGSWNFDLDLEAGSRTLTLEALDADGNVARSVDFPSFDVSAPSVDLDIPTLNLPDGELLGGALNLSGTGTPGSEVGVVVDGELVGTATVGDDGSWALDTELPAGDYDVRLQAIDLDGNVASESDGFNLSLGELTLPDFDLPGLDFNAGEVDLSGVGTPGSTMELVANGEVVGTAVVGDDGTWSIPVDLPVGDYDLSLRMLDADGNLLAESVGRNVTVAAEASGAEFVLPMFDLPAADLAGGDVTLTGIGTPGAEVEIVVNGEVVGTIVVGDDGSWEFPTTLPTGDYELTLRTVDDAGTAVETDPFTFSLAAAAPTLDEPADGSSADGGELAFSGMGEPGSEVEILDGDEVVGTAVVADDGTWNFSYTPAAGDHTFGVRAAGASETAATSNVTVTEAADSSDSSSSGETSSSGDAEASLPADFCSDAAPGIDQGDTYIVAACEWLTKIANRLGIPYADLIGVNPQIADPNLIYPGQIINLPPR